MASLTQELSLTSIYPHKGHRIYSERKLGSGYNTKPNRDANVFHRHGVYPVIILSGINPGLLKNQFTNLVVNATCATRVQMTNVKTKKNVTLLHLFLWEREKGDGIHGISNNSYS